jgi:ubiquinone/menaquinone biosynthesis C-methylase UbiE
VNRSKKDSVLKEYAKLAPRYDLRWDSYIRSSVKRTLARLPIREGERLLDVGCGTGQLLQALQTRPCNAELMGVDTTSEMLDVARSRLAKSTPLTVGQAEQLPFESASFDWLVSASVFHHIRKPGEALREFRRVLKPSGHLVITDWCHDYFACKILDVFLRAFNPSHFRTYTTRQCEVLLRESAFESIASERYRISFFWGLMTVWAEPSRKNET